MLFSGLCNVKVGELNFRFLIVEGLNEAYCTFEFIILIINWLIKLTVPFYSKLDIYSKHVSNFKQSKFIFE